MRFLIEKVEALSQQNKQIYYIFTFSDSYLLRNSDSSFVMSAVVFLKSKICK